MQDGIISGNGNSRYLKTVSAALGLYPTYEDFMAALIAGTFPIDLNGINAGGWKQQGTPLNKANLFSDSTASALGLNASNTPNDALAKIKVLIDAANTNANSRAKAQVLSYVGTGTYGNINPCSVTADFPIKTLIFLVQTSMSSYNCFTQTTSPVMVADHLTPANSYVNYSGMTGNPSASALSDGKKSTDGKTFSWYNERNAEYQMNTSNDTYYFLAIG